VLSTTGGFSGRYDFCPLRKLVVSTTGRFDNWCFLWCFRKLALRQLAASKLVPFSSGFAGGFGNWWLWQLLVFLVVLATTGFSGVISTTVVTLKNRWFCWQFRQLAALATGGFDNWWLRLWFRQLVVSLVV
jgi:hypothetical protein